MRCRADAIPDGIEVDVGGLEINHSKHLSDIKLPGRRARVVQRRDITLVTVVPPSGYAEEMKAAAEAAAAARRRRRCRCRRQGRRAGGAGAAPGAAPVPLRRCAGAAGAAEKK